MKSKINGLVLFFAVIITSVIFTQKASAQHSNINFQVFYNELSPYGDWVNYPDWGYVWIPDAGSDFVPYSTDGHWILTDYGWTWMSDYRWGWAPFHYGRWDFDHYYGWFWIPDNEWGPAWVTWRRADGYYGWAPMEPGISLSVSFGRGYDSHNDHWIFVRDRDIDRPDINNYYIGQADRDRIVRRSSVINSTYVDNRRHTTYVTGPARTDIQRITGRQVNTVAIEDYNQPGQEMSNGHYRIYRPEVVKSNNAGMKPAPSRIVNLKDVRKPSERNATNQPGNPNSSNTLRNERQPNNSKTQINNPPQNIKREAQPNNVKSQSTNPPTNIRRVEQPNTVKSQSSNPPQNIRREVQPDNVRSQSTNPPDNIRRVEQPNTVKSQSQNPPQTIRKEGQQNNGKQQNGDQLQNSGKEQKSNNSKQSGNNKKEQQKKSDVGKEDIKK